MKNTAKASKKGRKYSRNKVFCERYRSEGRRERNKKKKLLRHTKQYPNDLTAQRALRDF